MLAQEPGITNMHYQTPLFMYPHLSGQLFTTEPSPQTILLFYGVTGYCLAESFQINVKKNHDFTSLRDGVMAEESTQVPSECSVQMTVSCPAHPVMPPTPDRPLPLNYSENRSSGPFIQNRRNICKI